MLPQVHVFRFKKRGRSSKYHSVTPPLTTLRILHVQGPPQLTGVGVRLVGGWPHRALLGFWAFRVFINSQNPNRTLKILKTLKT
jgi:hypothetical protein